jgi:hypothetical protein
MLRGAGALGSALGIASMFFGDGDITKGGLGSAASGAMTGAGIGMMFGPLGALIGAGIGAAIGGIGTDKIMAGLKTAAQKAGEWWKGFAESNFGGTLIRLFKNGWDNFKQVGWDYIILLKDFFTLNWGALGKDLGKMWTDWYDGFKKQIGVMWDYLKTTDVGKAVCKLLGIETATPNISMSQDLLSGKGARPEVKDTQEGDTVSVNFPKIGNNASGLSYVPYDGYLTKLHKGERVLTDNQARNMDRAQDSSQDSGGGNMSVNFEQGAIQISMANASPAEIERAAQEMFKAFMKKIENKNIANYQPSRARGFVT